MLGSLLNRWIASWAGAIKLKIPKIPSFKLKLSLPKIELPKIPVYTPPKIDVRKNHATIITQVAPKLVDIEKQMSSGGTQIQTYTHDLQINVGAQYVGADIAPPVSVVDGYPVPSKVSIGSRQTSISQKTTPHVQSVTHSIPWGTLGIMACNKFNVVVGAGGIMMHTDGCVDINSGGRMNISSLHELNLTTSGGNLNITCGHNICIRGDTVTVGTTNKSDQVVVDSNLGVTKNLVVHGSTYVDGELYCQHISAPVVMRESSKEAPLAFIPALTEITGGAEILGIPMSITITLGENVPVQVMDHSHTFLTIASDTHTGNSKVREAAAADINGGSIGTAKAQDIGGTGMPDAVIDLGKVIASKIA